LEKDVFGSDDPPGFIAMTRRDFPDGVARISLKRATPSEVRREKEAYEAAKKREEALSEGFTLALRTLARSGAPAVGHNAMFDVVFTMDKFLAAEPGGLDGTYRGFKASLASALAGALYDTKLIAAGFAPVIAAVAGESGASVDTGLGPLYERLTRASVPKMLSSGNNNNAQATTVIDIKTKNGNGNENGKGKAKAVGGGKKNETKAKTKTKTKNARADAAGACAPFRRSGESVLDWIAFPESFTRYDAALHANASGDVDDDDDATDGGGGCTAFAHEAGYDAFMTGVCFLTMTVHGRALVDADGDGWISIFHGDGDAEAEAEAVAARPPLSRTSVGLLGNVPFAAADGAVPTQRSGAFYTLVPIRPRSRGERRSSRTFSPGVSLRPGSLAFNPRPRRLSTPTDAFQLHPDVRSYGTTLRSLAHATHRPGPAAAGPKRRLVPHRRRAADVRRDDRAAVRRRGSRRAAAGGLHRARGVSRGA
jgi:poly(A)-specific ribonuclease